MRRTSIALLFVSLAGCSGGSDFDDPEHVRDWANSASAVAVFQPAYEPISIADGERELSDPLCPTVQDDGTTLVLTGGCTDTAGTRWVGSATVVRGATGGYEVTLDGYGRADEDDPAEVSGTFSIVETAEGVHTFEADYEQDGLLSLDVTYSGSVEGGHRGDTLWNGSGTITRGGFTDSSGTATATTVDQLRDDACGNQASSGTTTIVHEGRTLVIEYDGETDCDEEQAARYRVDGEARGTIDGIVCSASPGRSSATALLALVGAAAMLVFRRRRRT